MAWRQAVDRRLRRLGVSQVGWMTIAAAIQARSPLSQSVLADGLAISRASMVQTIDGLVKKGLVMRESSAFDRRLKYVVVTEAGAHLYSLLKEEVAAVRRQMLAIVEAEKLFHLTELLEKLQAPIGPSQEEVYRCHPPNSSRNRRSEALLLFPNARHCRHCGSLIGSSHFRFLGSRLAGTHA
jgi:MarR family transcriptional regulator, transcriptional regulator for hemolysin